MSKKTYSGRNLDVAKKKAAKALGVDIGDLNFEILAGQMGGMALIRINDGGGKKAAAAAAPLTESLSGDAVNDEGEVVIPEGGGDEEPRRERRERRDDRDGDRGGRGGRGGDRGDRGGRGGRGDRDRGGRGGRDRDRGGRGRRGRDDDRGGRRRRSESRLPEIPSDGPTEVKMKVADGAELSELAEDAHEVMRDILTGMGFGMEVEMTEEEEVVSFNLSSGVYHPAMIANNMELLEAIQHLVDKIVNFDSEERKRIAVDSEGAKAEADQHLSESAIETAQRVIDEGEPIKIGPLDPRSRRIVHMTLRDTEGVTTKSEGEGAFRRVCIMPARD